MGSSKQTHTGDWRISARDAVPVTVLGILGEYEREHPGAVERFQQSQAEVDERLVQQALRRQEHQHARFVQEAERARYIKNFQARQLIKRALRRQMQQQAAARYEQYQARARQLALERERLEQTKNEILMAMKKRGEEERIQGVALALESVHGRVESSSLEHSRRDRFDRQSSVTYFASPQQIQALDSWQKWVSGTYPQGSRNSLPSNDPTTPRHDATLLADCKLDNDPSLSSMTPDHMEDDCERSDSLAWIFAGTKEPYPGASSKGQPTPKRIVAKAQIQDLKSLHPGAVGKESDMGSGDATSRDQFAEELIIPQASPYTASTIECLDPLLARVPSGDESRGQPHPASVHQPSERQEEGRVLVAQHIEDLRRLHAEREDERKVVAEEELKKRSTGSKPRQTGIGIDDASWAMREGFTDSENVTAAAAAWPDSRCQSPQNTSQIAVDNEPRWHSPRMRTSNPTFGRDKPFLAYPNTVSTRTPDLFHAADTVQIAGGTFTTAGTVTNITYSVTVPSRSYLPSIPLPSWFNRVRLS
ncbi:hypothetical protein BKA70DRAFT_1325002 [Coprinopsis sp. MPI-PUGE-AT-0042]|nr:hypothetical protein BKA70DRAFT_1325002 [Coprinopsis sp. MPI-PUGE-AT-0042]